MAIYVADAETTRRGMPRGAITSYHTPAGSLFDLDHWLKPEPRWLEHNATVVLPSWPTTRQQLLADIRARGWDTQPTDGGWFSCRRKMPDRTTRTLHLCILDWVGRDDPVLGVLKPLPGTNLDAANRAIAQVLVAWEDTMGAPYRHTPGVAAHDSIRMHHRAAQPQWAPYRSRTILEPEQAPAQAHIRPMLWRRPDAVTDGCKVVKFDQRRAYLAAMKSVNLPVGPLTNTGLDPEGPGYLRVHPTHPGHPLWQLVNRPDAQGTVWLGTTTARFFAETGPQAAGWELVDSWTARGQRLLRQWSARVQRLPASIAKPTYTQAVGMLNTKTGTIQRPDWYDLVIDQANATMLRRVNAVWQQLAQWPVLVHVDALGYIADTEYRLGKLSDLVKVGYGCGEMRVEDWSWR